MEKKILRDQLVICAQACTLFSDGSKSLVSVNLCLLPSHALEDFWLSHMVGERDCFCFVLELALLWICYVSWWVTFNWLRLALAPEMACLPSPCYTFFSCRFYLKFTRQFLIPYIKKCNIQHCKLALYYLRQSAKYECCFYAGSFLKSAVRSRSTMHFDYFYRMELLQWCFIFNIYICTLKSFIVYYD